MATNLLGTLMMVELAMVFERLKVSLINRSKTSTETHPMARDASTIFYKQLNGISKNFMVFI